MNSAFDQLLKAKKMGYAIGAFNAANTETLKAITQAARNLRSPVLIEASDGEVSYFGIKQLAAVVQAYREELNIPIILNLDHGKDLDSCIKAIDAGFDYIHFDGSKLKYEENVFITKEVVKYAHSKGIPVEGEMDHIEGSSANHLKESAMTLQDVKKYTDPKKAQDFVLRTGIDTFASFIGNLHGVYGDEGRLNLGILNELSALLPNTFFSLHGGSGLNDDDVMAAIRLGICKVNVNTDMRIVFKESLQKTLNETEEIAVYKVMGPAITAVQEVVEKKMKLFWSDNKLNQTSTNPSN